MGYPDRLTRAIGHPVIWIGRLIRQLDIDLNRTTHSDAARRVAGICVAVVLVTVSAMVGFLIETLLLLLPVGFFFAAIPASTLLAQRSLYAHVTRVADALQQQGLATAREVVSHIVGRDPEMLDEAGVSRAAIESLAENFSDAVVAPAFWLAVGGLAAGTAYKSINTGDSMIGHRTPRHEQFGWAVARLDDLVNLPASRLSALLIIAAAAATPGASPRNAWQAVRRDASLHRSPNAGYPEAAMAGALGLALAGPRIYAGQLVQDAFMGDGRREANAADIHAALKLYRRADALLIFLIAMLVWVLSVSG